MSSSIKIIDSNGSISEVAIYSIGSKAALICYLEQHIKGNYHTWNYDESEFSNEIKELKHGGWTYYDKEKDITICSKEK